MLIECRARRVARDPRIGRKDRDIGTKAKVYGKIYHFRPQPDLIPAGCDSEAHVCEVSDDRAIKRFLEGLPEQFNEIGKPPRIPQDSGPRQVHGQIETVIELLDDDDQLGDKDVREIDPLAGAKRLQKEWIDDMLEQPVKHVAKELHRYNADEIQTLIDAEKKGKKRKSMIETLLVAQDEAIAAAESAPQLPPDDDLALE
jgi:hypothetical protein